MQLVGSRGETAADRSYRLDGTITAGGTSQIVSPIPTGRSYLFLQNTSSGNLYFELGGARAVATITSGAVTAVTITNGGKGFTAPPVIEFLGGAGYAPLVALGPSGAGLPGYASPNNAPNNAGGRPARARCVLTGGVVTSIVIDDPGSGYIFPPFVDIRNEFSDRYGGADPNFGGVNSGMFLGSGQSFYESHTAVPVEQIYVWGATTGQTFMFRWVP